MIFLKVVLVRIYSGIKKFLSIDWPGKECCQCSSTSHQVQLFIIWCLGVKITIVVLSYTYISVTIRQGKKFVILAIFYEKNALNFKCFKNWLNLATRNEGLRRTKSGSFGCYIPQRGGGVCPTTTFYQKSRYQFFCFHLIHLI